MYRHTKTIQHAMQVFSDRYPLIGPAFWLLSIQYFVIQVITARAWHMPYSLKLNAISDLGNTVCGEYGQRYVCSPRHNLMNASFIVLGITMFCGACLIYQEFRKSPATFIGFGCMSLAGIGTVLVGLFPENTIGEVHLLGAALPFLVGNLGIIVLGAGLQIGWRLRLYSILSGVTALIGLILLLSSHYANLGFGGMERLTAYPQTVWLIVFGWYMSRKRFAGHSM